MALFLGGKGLTSRQLLLVMTGNNADLRPDSVEDSVEAGQGAETVRMIDFFAIGLTHALIALAALRLLMRPDLDRDPVPSDPDPVVAATPPSAPSAPKRPEMRRA
jgi:hypothetical protein